MRLKATTVLAVVLALLVAYLYFVELPKEETAEVQRIFSFSETDIRQVTITGAQGTFVIRPGHPPLITAPIKTVADTGSVAALTRQISSLTPIKTLQEEADLAPFGLDQPAYKIDVSLKDSPVDPILLGGENIVGQVYAKIGKTVYLVESTLKASLHKGLDDWRKREMFEFSVPEVKSVSLDRDGESLLFEKQGVEWLIKPQETKADASKVSSLISSLSFLRGEGFIDEDKEARIQDLGAPLLTVKLSLAETEYHGIFYGSPEEPDFVYGVTAPDAPIYKVARDRFDAINKPVSDFVPQEPEKKEESP